MTLRRKSHIRPPVDADRLTGREVSNAEPTDQQALVWNAAEQQWEPQDQTGIGGGGGSGDPFATYVVLSTTSSLAGERVLTAGNGINISDAGAGSTVTVAIDATKVAQLQGGTFTGNVAFGAGLSGSLQRTSAGQPYLVGSQPVQFTTSSNGTITASLNSSGFAGTGGTAVSFSNGVFTVSSSAPVIQSLAGAGGTSVSNSGGAYTVSGSAQTVASIVGSGGTSVSNSGTRWTISSSAPVVEYISGTGGIAVTNNGTSWLISGSVGGGGYPPDYASLTGSTFTGAVLAGGGLSGSLQQTTAGLSYLVAQGALTITSQSNGQIILSASGGGGGGSTVVQATGGTSISGDGSLATPYILSSSLVTVAGAGGITVTNGGGTTYTISGSAQVVQSIAGAGGVSVSNSGGAFTISGSAPGVESIIAGSGISVSNVGTRWTVAATGGGGGGGSQANTIFMSASQTLATPSATTFVLAHTVNTAMTATLPIPSASIGYPIYFKDVQGFASASSQSTFLVKRNGSEKIDGQSSDYLFQSPWGALGFISNGTDWFIV